MGVDVVAPVLNAALDLMAFHLVAQASQGIGYVNTNVGARIMRWPPTLPRRLPK
jgi:hypothetical protein